MLSNLPSLKNADLQANEYLSLQPDGIRADSFPSQRVFAKKGRAKKGEKKMLEILLLTCCFWGQMLF